MRKLLAVVAISIGTLASFGVGRAGKIEPGTATSSASSGVTSALASVASSAVPAAASSALDAAPASSASVAAAKHEEAKKEEVKKEAELTPIIPSPSDPLKPAFQLYSEIDLPVLAIGVAFASARLLGTQPAYCAPRCDPKELNAFDRTTAGFWSPPWALASDIGALTLVAGSATLLVADEGLLPALNDAVVVAQSALLATAGPTMLTIAAGRPRPFLYGDNAPYDPAPNGVRHGADAGLSFISSHTSVSFAIVTATYMTMKRRHPRGLAKYLVLGVGLPIAATVGTARVMAGRHFMTDAILGAIVGSAMGILVPALHDSPIRVLPKIEKGAFALTIEGIL